MKTNLRHKIQQSTIFAIFFQKVNNIANVVNFAKMNPRMEIEEKKPKRGRPPKGAEPKFKTIQADVNEALYTLWSEELKKTGFTGSMFLRSVVVQFLIDRGKIAGWEEVKERFGRTPKLPGK